MSRASAPNKARARVIAALEKGGPQTRAMLSRHADISRSTSSGIISELLEEGIVEIIEMGPDATRAAGRPGSLVALCQDRAFLVAIDFGRLGLKVGLFDPRYRLIDSYDGDFSVDVDANEALEAAARQVDILLSKNNIDKTSVEAVGVGVPGPVEAETGCIHAGSILAGWIGTDVPGELSKRLGLPVFMDNDANLGMLAESQMGGAMHAKVALYVLLSVGVGLGIAINGEVFRGTGGIAGELGHVVTNENGPVCRCGSRGCLEAQISVNALAQSLSATHRDLTATQMLKRAAEGDLVARRVVIDAGAMAGRQVGALCNYFNPDLILVGGELMRAGNILIDAIKDSMARTTIARAVESVAVRPGALGELAELYGAAIFAHQKALRAMHAPADRKNTR